MTHKTLIRTWTPFFLLAMMAAGATAATPFRIIVNNREVDTAGSPPAVINNSLLVPLAAIGNALGAYMEWRPQSRTVYGRLNMNEFILPINITTAAVNGVAAPVNPPAQIVGGRTMVPLRFVATALGADVRFDGASKTVNISTTGGSSGNATPPPPTGATPVVDRFFVSPTTPLNAGDTFTVTLEGTPGLRAEFDYGAQRNLSLTESAPGRYTRSIQVPANAPFARSVVTGRLIGGGQTREIQAGERVVVDTVKPIIKDARPKSNATVATREPYISAEFDDQGQTGVDTSSVKMLLNGEDVTDQANVSADRIVFRNQLPVGDNKVRVEVSDLAANKNAVEWTFKVSGESTAEAPPAPTITEPRDGESVKGDLVVQGTATPNATVRVRTTYTGTVLVILSQTGEVNAQEVKADAAGKWKTAPIALKAPSGVSNARFTITATAINAQGLTSEPTQVTVPRQ